MTREEAKKAVEKFGSVTGAARGLKVARNSLRWALRDKDERPSSVAKVPIVRTVSEFRKTYDKDTIVPSRIRNGLKKLGRGGWAYEVDFVRLAEINTNDLRVYRDAFAQDHVVEIKDGRRVWTGSKSTTEELRAML
jgi:hypothetical protein